MAVRPRLLITVFALVVAASAAVGGAVDAAGGANGELISIETVRR